MSRSRRRVADRLAFGLTAIGVAAACAGEPFTPLVTSSTPGDGGPESAHADTGMGQNPLVPDSGPNNVEDAPEGPCAGIALRTDDNRAEVCLDGGTFVMGSNQRNLGDGFADHTPAHPATVKAFVLDVYEVTVERYAACVTTGVCTIPKSNEMEGCTWSAGDPLRPITCVTWLDALTFCRWDQRRRLPTEAEWEYAARSGDDRPYPWGEGFDCSRAVIGSGTACPEYVGSLPRPVGSRFLGQSDTELFDVAGNVAEWVADWAGSYQSAHQVDPTGPSSGASRVLRGGSWNSSPQAGFTYARASAAPQSAGRWGFRCARDPSP